MEKALKSVDIVDLISEKDCGVWLGSKRTSKTVGPDGELKEV